MLQPTEEDGGERCLPRRKHENRAGAEAGIRPPMYAKADEHMMTRSVAGAAEYARRRKRGGQVSLRRDAVLCPSAHTVLNASRCVLPYRNRSNSSWSVSADVHTRDVLKDGGALNIRYDAAGIPAAFKANRFADRILSTMRTRSETNCETDSKIRVTENPYARDPPRQNKTGIVSMFFTKIFARMFSENPKRRRGHAEQYTEKNKKEQVS